MDEANAAERIVRASVEAYNRHDLDGCMSFLAPDATWELMGMGGQTLTPEELRIAFWQYILRDVRVEIRSLSALDTCVAVEYVQSYIDDGDQGRKSAPVACFYEVRDGQIVRVRHYFHPSWDRPESPQAAEDSDEKKSIEG
jgi:ketosteroid isomerase-like protein